MYIKIYIKQMNVIYDLIIHVCLVYFHKHIYRIFVINMAIYEYISTLNLFVVLHPQNILFSLHRYIMCVLKVQQSHINIPKQNPKQNRKKIPRGTTVLKQNNKRIRTYNIQCNLNSLFICNIWPLTIIFHIFSCGRQSNGTTLILYIIFCCC